MFGELSNEVYLRLIWHVVRKLPSNRCRPTATKHENELLDDPGPADIMYAHHFHTWVSLSKRHVPFSIIYWNIIFRLSKDLKSGAVPCMMWHDQTYYIPYGICK
jgi:hypothetical protein